MSANGSVTMPVSIWLATAAFMTVGFVGIGVMSRSSGLALHAAILLTSTVQAGLVTFIILRRRTWLFAAPDAATAG